MMMTANRGLPLSSKIFMMEGGLSKDRRNRSTGIFSNPVLFQRVLRVTATSKQCGHLFPFIICHPKRLKGLGAKDLKSKIVNKLTRTRAYVPEIGN